MHERDGLAILRQEAAIRNVDDLQLIRIVIQLHRYRDTRCVRR